MKKSLFASVAALAFGLTSFADTDMVTKLKTGELVRYSVNEIEEVFFEEIIDTTETTLKFSVTSDSTAKLSFGNCAEGFVTIPSKVRIGGKAYTVTSIGSSAFEDCTDLTGVRIPSNVTIIQYSAFSGCTGLTSVSIPSSVTCIEGSAFRGSGLTSLEIPESVDTIGHSAFSDCESLTDVKLSSNLKTLEISLFSYCSSLKSIVIPAGKSIKTHAFYGCKSLTTVEISAGAVINSVAYDAFSQCTSLTEFIVPADNQTLSSEGGILYNKDKSILIKYPIALQGELVIPSSVTEIGISAFDGCKGITRVEIPSSVEKIRAYAFRGCLNLDIIIDNSEDNVSVGDGALKSCKSVTWLK
jgi:hypothetical protein